MADTEIDLLRSSLDLLILKSLAWGPRHGVAVAEWIEAATQDALHLEEGTLYPALHRLERKGWLKSEWGMSDSHRRAKFYRMTTTGRARLREEAPAWQRFAGAIASALQAKAPDIA